MMCYTLPVEMQISMNINTIHIIKELYVYIQEIK